MNIIWESDQSLKPAEVLERLDCSLAYTTVMTVMKRLVDKKLLKRQKKGNVYHYSVAVDRRQFAEKNLSKLYERLVDCYGDLAISQFVRAVKDRPHDLRLLKNFIDKNP